MKNVLIISSSPRMNGNSYTLAKEFERGALENKNNKVTFIDLNKIKINYCKGCYYCMKNGKCYQKDDFNSLIFLLKESDVILFATPVYFYSMSGQMKVFIDRFVGIYLDIKADIYLAVTAADDNQKNLISTVESLRGLTRDCFESCEEKGVILGSNLSDFGDVNKRKDLLDQAYRYGKEC